MKGHDQLSETFVPIEDTCRVCGLRIWWAEGGLFWLHVDNPDADHVAEPSNRTDLEPFTGCTLHRDTPQPDVCDTCGRRGRWAETP